METTAWLPEELAEFAAAKTALLASYRRDGHSVATPVTIAVVGEHVFFRTYDRSGKAKRLRHDPDVEVAPSDVRGRPHGRNFRARARLLEADEERTARHAIGRRAPLLQGVLVPLYHKLARYRTLHYELTPRREVGRLHRAA